MMFRDLQPGALFEFAAERQFYSMARGPWLKLSPRKYRGPRGEICRVGTVHALVIPVNNPRVEASR